MPFHELLCVKCPDVMTYYLSESSQKSHKYEHIRVYEHINYSGSIYFFTLFVCNSALKIRKIRNMFLKKYLIVFNINIRNI